MRGTAKIAIFVLMALLVLALLVVDEVPSRSVTHGRMSVTKRRILQYARQHDHLPENLSELPPMPGYDTAIVDAWGQPLYYSCDLSGVVTLKSLGSDKCKGGVENARDMIGVFSSRDPEGHWQDEFIPWTHDPFEP